MSTAAQPHVRSNVRGCAGMPCAHWCCIGEHHGREDRTLWPIRRRYMCLFLLKDKMDWTSPGMGSTQPAMEIQLQFVWCCMTAEFPGSDGTRDLLTIYLFILPYQNSNVTILYAAMPFLSRSKEICASPMQISGHHRSPTYQDLWININCWKEQTFKSKSSL